MHFEILQHPNAPLFKHVKDAQTLFYQLFSEIESPNFSPNEEIKSLLRQASLVNLWFFLKYIAGSEGPYAKLNTDLHLDMCNFRQSPNSMGKGARFGMFLPRGFYKSTIATHGADTWEIIRNPNIRILVANAVYDRAADFVRNIAETFRTNKLVGYLFPEFIPQSGQLRYNESEIAVPCRTIYSTEPTVKPSGITGSGEGYHYDLIDIDDPVGLSDLNAERRSNAEMEKKKQWFRTNKEALLMDKTSRIGVKGTRFGIDDFYQDIFDNCRTFVGYPHPSFNEKQNGEWAIYYRKSIEDGIAICPEIKDEKDLDRIRETDFWTFNTQYQNDPVETGLAEFNRMEVKKALLLYDKEDRPYIMKKTDLNFPENTPESEKKIYLEDCHCIMAIDPAGTDKPASARACKSSIVIWCKDYKENLYLIWERSGYYNIYKVFDTIFEGAKLFNGYVETCVVETNAMQKILKPLLEQERMQRNIFIGFTTSNSSSDKEARIRSTLGVNLMKGKIYVCEGTGFNFVEEQKIFPQSPYRMDTLDASEKAISQLRTPNSPYGEPVGVDEEMEDWVQGIGRSAKTGY